MDWQTVFHSTESTLKMTSSQAFKTSLTNNSPIQKYPHLDDTIQYKLLIFWFRTIYCDNFRLWTGEGENKSASEASRRARNKLRRAKRAKYDGFPPQNPAFFFRPITDYNPIRSLFTGYGNFTLQNLLASPSWPVFVNTFAVSDWGVTFFPSFVFPLRSLTDPSTAY